MIRITVELFPYGQSYLRQTLAVADIWNTGDGGADAGAYGYALYKRNGHLMRSGYISWFSRRAFSVWWLIAGVLRVAFPEIEKAWPGGPERADLDDDGRETATYARTR